MRSEADDEGTASSVIDTTVEDIDMTADWVEQAGENRCCARGSGRCS